MLGLGLSEIVPYVVYGLAGPVIIASAVNRSAIGLLFLVPLIPLYVILDKVLKSELPLANNVIDFTIIAMLLGICIQKRDDEVPALGPSPLLKPLAIFAGYSFISLLIGSASFDGLTGEINLLRLAHWKNYMIMPLLYLITYYALRERAWQNKLFTFLFGAFLVADIRFQQSFKWVKHTRYQGSKSRVSGLANLGPNEMGAFHAIHMLFVLGLFIIDKNVKRRIAYVFFMIGSTYCALYSYSRGAYVAILLTAIFIAFVKERRLLIVIVAFLITWKAILPSSVVDRIENTIVEDGARTDVVEVGGMQLETAKRTEIWEKALGYFYENPITGKGYNTYQYLTGWDTHNVYIKFMAEEGVIGLSLYIWLYVLALRSGWKLYKNGDEEIIKAFGFGFVCAVIASIVSNFFGDRWTYLQLGGIYWVLWALVDQHNARIAASVTDVVAVPAAPEMDHFPNSRIAS
ncbi:O-antigen polymerase [Geobacter metallireducens RCH3]|uniref:Lipid A core--O antigen ligase-related protein n=2 Tax=Geobacter metallireducens TaxID=28232 RepID=Q39U36_GEOMG|nr:lipid A core--O antigen ligase-related protein [Geobacter metallireducens GS-15]EHP86994.1 O-antigen polymerase [Geobacter metallireducens RCH3]